MDGQTRGSNAEIRLRPRVSAAWLSSPATSSSRSASEATSRIEAAPGSNLLPFIGLTALLLAIPAILVVLLGSRAQVVLPKIRDWMDANSWIVSEAVLLLFIVIILTGG